MPIEEIDIAEPFFGVRFVTDEPGLELTDRAILLNLGVEPVHIDGQAIGHLQSVIVQNIRLENIGACVLIDRFDAYPDEAALMSRVRGRWPSAFEIRGEERLRGIKHYMSPKIWVGRVGLTFYHSASVPLKVGLHRDHPFCPVPGFREVHTQIVGIGKMQQCREKDPDTLYLEEMMAPGITHRPMFDEAGNYPWHQYETVTPGIFMAVELLPDDAPLPA